jgi:hypothetical protein
MKHIDLALRSGPRARLDAGLSQVASSIALRRKGKILRYAQDDSFVLIGALRKPQQYRHPERSEESFLSGKPHAMPNHRASLQET